MDDATDKPEPADTLAETAEAGNTVAKTKRSAIGWLLAVGGIGSLISVGLAAALSNLDRIPWPQAVANILYSGLAGGAVLLLLVIVLLRRRQKGKRLFELPVLLGLATALTTAIYAAGWGIAWISHPAIHDVSTELADPPRFATLTVRQDNFDAIPGAEDSEMAGLNPRQRWAAIHQREYSDIRSVRIDAAPEAVIEKARRLVTDRGWDLAESNQANTLEARGEQTLVGLRFVVALRARPLDEGDASLIDLRMVTEEGQSDYGVLAPEIRSFLADLSGTTTALQDTTTPAR